jgi:hypothetical protein
MGNGKLQKKLEKDLENLIIEKGLEYDDFGIVEAIVQDLDKNQFIIEEFREVVRKAFIEAIKKQKEKIESSLKHLSNTLDQLTAPA